MNEVDLMSPLARLHEAGADLCLKAADLQAAGYQHLLYGQSLSEFGQPVELPLCGGWLLERPIPGAGVTDAAGAYPLFCCRDWALLEEDLRQLARPFVSITLVADPFGNHTESLLRSVFDRVVPFKTHFMVDLELPVEQFTSASHRKRARRAQRQLQIEICAEPLRELDTWCELYGRLVQRHQITGIRAFSRSAFELQLQVPGLVMFRASQGDRTVGLDLWYVQGDVAQGHLAATTELGYELHAAYGLKLAIISHFKGRVRWLNLGGVPGTGQESGSDGLAAFKRGWASGTRTAWLCGRILRPSMYEELCRVRGIEPSIRYFPAYRHGEFV